MTDISSAVAEEPLLTDSAQLRAPDTMLSPHSAGYSDRSVWRLGTRTVGDAIEWLQHGQVRYGAVVVPGTGWESSRCSR